MTTPASALPHGATRLHDWGVIRATGAEAAKFLHGQLTQDIENLRDDQARLAGYCSAKGRLLATFVVWRHGSDEVLLACSADVLPAVLKRLTMFVLRAKCKLSDASGEVALTGIAGPGVELLMPAATAWSKLDSNQGALLRLPDVGGVPRCIVAGPAQPLQAGATPLALDAWRALEVRSGIALIEAATVDQFVPQMLNFELVGGVDFQKGCYPGQEIVARSQYRGTIKRRMFVFTCDAPAQAGQEVFHSADAEQPAGMVVNAVPAGAGCVALVEVKLAAFDQGSLHLGSVNGPVMHVGTLPYALPSDASLRA